MQRTMRREPEIDQQFFVELILRLLMELTNLLDSLRRRESLSQLGDLERGRERVEG